jgi:hypothetical protein
MVGQTDFKVDQSTVIIDQGRPDAVDGLASLFIVVLTNNKDSAEDGTAFQVITTILYKTGSQY